jgi:hypothetical protein
VLVKNVHPLPKHPNARHPRKHKKVGQNPSHQRKPKRAVQRKPKRAVQRKSKRAVQRKPKRVQNNLVIMNDIC